MARVGYKPTVYDPNDVARTTIKETNIHDNRIGTMSTNRPKNQIYNQDSAKKTVRETTDEPDKTLNMSSIHKMHTVYDPNDVPEPTTKDTNIHNTRMEMLECLEWIKEQDIKQQESRHLTQINNLQVILNIRV